MARLLLIDDDELFAEEARERLVCQGHTVRYQDTADEALGLLAGGERFDLILLDNKMPRMTGLEFLNEAARRGWRTPVILMTGAHDDRTAIQATNRGAFGYVIKRIDMDEFLADLLREVNRALELTRRPCPVPIPGQEADAPDEQSALVGQSGPMLDLLKRIGRVAGMEETVLIRGETGTGKDLVARALHTNSPRQAGPFVVLDCTAFNENLIEAELFGHEPGAFTGAAKLRKGHFEHANGGTLFLDEVGELPPTIQAKLLRVLENREVVRMGSNDPIRVNVRILAATHRDLPAMVREWKLGGPGGFREDLFYRLEGVSVHLPPLRERDGDVERLARTFLARMFAGGGRPALHPLALQKLNGYHWPGNVRQLHKVICRAAVDCRNQQIMPEDIDFGELGRAEKPPALDEPAGLRGLIEKAWHGGQARLWDHLHDLLDRELLSFAQAQGASEVEIAARLGKSRNYVRDRLKQLGLKPPAEE
jgi:DNA-binding NtrC family response regulator